MCLEALQGDGSEDAGVADGAVSVRAGDAGRLAHVRPAIGQGQVLQRRPPCSHDGGKRRCNAEPPDARARPRYLHATVLPAGPERALLGVLLPGVARCDGVAPWQEGKFKADSVPEGQNRMPVEIQVTDPMEKLLFSKDDIEPESSSFAFTTSVAGDYIV